VRTRPGKYRNRSKLVPVKPVLDSDRGTGIEENSKMLKKVTTDIKAAVVLIITENLTALRMFVKNVTNSVIKFVSKHQKAMRRDKKRP